MARRRMIDPNIWGSEDMSKLTIRQRMLVIGLFSNADDYGKGKAKSTYLRSIIFPYDDIPIADIDSDLKKIQENISIRFYEVEGNSYYKFINWQKWQTVQKPQKSIIPEPVENDSLPSQEPFSPKGKEEKGKEDEGNIKERNSESDSIETLKDDLLKLINTCKLKNVDFFVLDQIYSFIGVAETEVIEAAIKKASDKHINYAVNTLKNWVAEGKTKKESLNIITLKGAEEHGRNGEGHPGSDVPSDSGKPQTLTERFARRASS